ncbi:hypothetical protein NM952_11715 [Pasteurella multocida subsp. multocida]|uniref:Uncharacterized protein n=1 Tax=Pasteurella multocida TaxID=747 RepID=A0A9X3UNN1_PASMD|nr:hypothetical protein [Pasteurella multocida]EGP02569.1 hypothetical protein GEW_13396 [Pasteurella multocida subsp. gallicida str. Anand1_poultry]MBF6979498.1 hypothetical protein [Pasteurella multocida]MDA5609226.1 hypothetical protein [Pasteurella multocida subsp. multocida]MDA5609883.1 hypothetical protein [Pasteurella multocida]MDA5614167.1 hypothetical protein [Pasteurella multocida]
MTAVSLSLTPENRLYRALKENKDNYTIDSKGQVNLKPEYANRKLQVVLANLKDVKVQAR